MKYPFLPFESYTLATRLSTDEVRERILSFTEPPKFFRFDNEKPYQGEIDGENFRVRRIIRYRNSYLPVIKGRIIPGVGETNVSIVMRPTIYALVMTGIGLGIVIPALVYFTNYFLESGLSSGLTFCLLVLAVGWTAMMLFFKHESKKSKKFFVQLLEAEEVSPLS